MKVTPLVSQHLSLDSAHLLHHPFSSNLNSALICAHWGSGSLWGDLPSLMCVQHVTLWALAMGSPSYVPAHPRHRGQSNDPRLHVTVVSPVLMRSHIGAGIAQVRPSFLGQPERVPGTSPGGDQGKGAPGLSPLVPFSPACSPTT